MMDMVEKGGSRVDFGGVIELARSNATWMMHMGILLMAMAVADFSALARQLVESKSWPDALQTTIGLAGMAMMGVGVSSFRRGIKGRLKLKNLDQESHAVMVKKPD